MTPQRFDPGGLPASAARDAENARIAAVAKAQGRPARMGIFKLHRAKRACIACDIVEEVGLAPSAVSKHLRMTRTHALPLLNSR